MIRERIQLASLLWIHLFFFAWSSISWTAQRLVIISPHWEGLRYEFARAFSDWHQTRYGETVEVSDSLILAMKEHFYPITKEIWVLMGRIEPDAPSLACAMGVLGMVLLTISLFVASKALGKKMGQLFRAG